MNGSFRLYLFACFIMGFLSGTGGAQVTSPSQQSNPYKVLDAAARAAQQNDDASVHALAEAVFSFPRRLSRMPDVIENPIKDRLVNAELAFRHGSQQAVREEDIVKLVNSMADKLHAPTYAKTSLKQVRVLRMRLLLASPVFMSGGLAAQQISIGSSVSPEMSPLQAVHLINSMVDQKLINPEFQMEPGDWERSQVSVEMERIKAAQERLQSSHGNSATRAKGSIKLHRRDRDFENAISQAGSNLSFLDAVSLIDEAFTTLKLNH